MSQGTLNLPGTITAITPQKKNKDRYSVFVDEKFLIGVADETLLNNDLKKGVEMTPSLFRKLQREEGRFAVKSYLLKLLSRRDHARRELINKARRKDYPPEIIKDVLDELEQKGYVDEQNFAELFARDKSYLNKWGPAKIKAHLAKKGISKSIREKVTDQMLAELDVEQRLRELVKKRSRRYLREEDPFKRKKKVFDYLQRKGYYPSSIYNHLEMLMNLLENEQLDT